MWHTYYAPRDVDGALELLAKHGDACRVIAGGTDLILEIERGVRKQQVLVDVSRVEGLDRIAEEDGRFSLGALVTHNHVVASQTAVASAFPLARACWLVGAPQIRNRGTVAGNLITASPANDTITPLWAMDATVTLASATRGERTLTFPQFFQGVRRTALQPDELLVRIDMPLLRPTERGTFLKLGLRQAQAISVVNIAAIVDFNHTGACRLARIALGAVAPTIIRATEAEAYLTGKPLSDDVIAHAAELAAAASRPISDIRGSAEYRRDMVRVLVSRALCQLRDGTECEGWPERPVLLAQSSLECAALAQLARSAGAPALAGVAEAELPHSKMLPASSITFTLNGRPVTLHSAGGKTLLRALREEAGLTGTKEGCAEGECGACTVWLDGAAVMSCLVPAERAEGCHVVTVEGLSSNGQTGALHQEVLHPLQRAFIDAGAVQCGYCTPGLLMSAAGLLKEVPQPTAAQVKEALTGNLCRCTGYYKILEAVTAAAANAERVAEHVIE